MNAAEAAQLLTVASGIDRRKVDELTAMTWASILADYPYVQAEAAVFAHFRDPDTRHEYLKVAHVLDRLESTDRRRTNQVADDVRSAKTRGLITKDWHPRQPLPLEVAAQLRDLREQEREESEPRKELDA